MNPRTLAIRFGFFLLEGAFSFVSGMASGAASASLTPSSSFSLSSRDRGSVKIIMNRIPQAQREITAAVEDAVAASAEIGAEMARWRAPVLTGRLRDSIAAERHGDTWVIRSSAPYAKYVQFGTVDTKATPFLTFGLGRARQALPGEAMKRTKKWR